MAATALYASITKVRDNAYPVGDSYSVSNGDGTATFTLRGGHYTVDVVASTFGTVTLQRLGPDGSTYVGVKNDAGAAITFSANGSLNVQLSAGQYKFALA